MEYAAIITGLALIAYGSVVMRRPWDWYLVNEVEPFDWWPKSSAELLAESIGVAASYTPMYAAAKRQAAASQAALAAQYEAFVRQKECEAGAYANSKPDSKDLADQMRAARNVRMPNAVDYQKTAGWVGFLESGPTARELAEQHTLQIRRITGGRFVHNSILSTSITPSEHPQ